MTDISVATTATAIDQVWAIPQAPASDQSSIPRGQVIYSGQVVLPSVLAVDEQVWTLTMALAGGFGYRMVDARVDAIGAGVGDLGEYQTGLRCTVATDEPEVPDWNFELQANSVGFDWDFLSSTDQSTRFFTQSEFNEEIILSTGTAQLVCVWANTSNAATAAVTVEFRFRFLKYGIEQLMNYQAHTPVPVISP